uniref:von Willebrand factor type A n=1 Tax=Cyanothece sp. (strain PCC 7425 / ATCC 29141) TaxID=395961 RepID=B8HNU4_CYAP4
MSVRLLSVLSDDCLSPTRVSQRQLEISVAAIAQASGERNAPLNLGLILDHSGSMAGQPLETVKRAAQKLVDRLLPSDRLAVIVFDHVAKVLIPNQPVTDRDKIKTRISHLAAMGGTAIDEGLQLGLTELIAAKAGAISQIFLLTDGENEHGNNSRCLQLAEEAAKENITLNTLGFGYHWNQDVLEQIADAAGGSLMFIEYPQDVLIGFERLFNQIISVGFTNAHLHLSLSPGVRLANLKPIAQVAPATIDLPHGMEGNTAIVRLGDLLTDTPRTLLANLYIDPPTVAHPLPSPPETLATLQIRYDDPTQEHTGLRSEPIAVLAHRCADQESQPNPQVQKSILALAKYRQTQLAEAKLHQGDRAGAATMLHIAAQTALQMGDQSAATLLQSSATRLQQGENLSERDRKHTRLAAKTTLQNYG